MPHQREMSNAEFIQAECIIHGRFGDKVYQIKRNGEMRVYDYEFKPKYAATDLSRRTDCIMRTAYTFTNPRYDGFQSIINKLFYYTPYFVHAGSYGFSCNTFFKLRQKGDYTLEINGVRLEMKLAPRSKVSLCFSEGTEYQVKLYRNNYLYCEREVIVLAAEEEVDDAYEAWFAEHLEEVLTAPDPRFSSLRIYRRGVVPNLLYQYLAGKTEQGVLYRSSYWKRFMYVRSAYEHHHTAGGDHFYVSQRNITACWNAASDDFKAVWEKYHTRWFDANYFKNWKIMRQHNLWSKLVFRACADMCFDPEELSPENWLPGVETLGDLILTANMGNYGLTEEELNTRVYYHE
ncbi:MAG: hypothetical protein K9N06_11420 [Candidatus Cloacimonetes bacterium]|nr:hypothetical protein [Candidatus Cloacimonadota bacterium]